MNQNPPRWPTTDAGLLRRMRDLRDREAWEEFLEIYGPCLDYLLRRHGLSAADASDVSQETFLTVATHIKGFVYNDSKRFRSWLATVALRKAWRMLKKKQREAQSPGGTTNIELLQNVDQAGGGGDDIGFQLAYVLGRTRAEVSEAEWEAFRLTVLEDGDNGEIARRLGIDIGCLYVRKARAKKTLMRILTENGGGS